MKMEVKSWSMKWWLSLFIVGRSLNLRCGKLGNGSSRFVSAKLMNLDIHSSFFLVTKIGCLLDITY